LKTAKRLITRYSAALDRFCLEAIPDATSDWCRSWQKSDEGCPGDSPSPQLLMYGCNTRVTKQIARSSQGGHKVAEKNPW